MIEIKEFEVLAGTSIREAVKEAIKIANDSNCVVRFNFNEIEIKIYDFSNINDKVGYYYRRLKENENA
jgi:hypothetical protein